MKQAMILGLTAGLMLTSAAWAQTATSAAPADQTAAQNQKMSQQYDSLVSSNTGFKNSRMHKECDSIAADDLKQQCMSSFGASAGSMGSMGNMGSAKPAPKR